MKLIHKVLAPMASLKIQERYVIDGTKEEYLLPEELLNSAKNILFEQKGIVLEENEILSDLKKAIRAIEIPDEITGDELVRNYEPWRRIRELSKDYLVKDGFDLEGWERNEL
ncbi:MAG: hypothetical protein HUJ28_00645 [Chromatiales bacterium]|nr:hypothetical protein [Chromatiales bacterium]